MKVLISFMKKCTGYYVVAFIVMLAGIALDMFNPKMMQRLIDEVIIARNTAPFKGILIALVGITLGRAVFGYTKEILFDLSSTKIIIQLRKKLFDHIQTLSFSFFDKNNTGELMSRVKDDAENVMNAICYGAMLFIEQALYFVIASVVLFTLNWKLAILSLCILPIIAFVAVQLRKQVGKTYEEISDQRAAMNTTAQENLAGVRLVKAFGRENHEIEKFLKMNKENYRLNVNQAKVWSRHQPRIEFLSNFIVVMITSVGGYLVIGKELSIGTLVAYVNYIYMLIWPMRMIGWLINILSQCMASLKKIDVLFDEVPDVKNPESPVEPAKREGHVVFDHVSLVANGMTILDDVCLDAKPGSTVAIMGATGAGKSSLINLIGRYYDCTSGRILMDGVDVRDQELEPLRKNVSVVMQDVFLFSDTIEENIRFGSPEIPMESLVSASKDAHVHEFVMKLSDGYKTVVGERGIGLSGGQKQRISMARALARDSRVLVFDDATSALDMETEHQIQQALDTRAGVTKFIIAHRVSAVKNADEIIILDHGAVIERGSHQELLEQRGYYYDTYVLQFQGLLDIHEEEVS
jgi:ATP-binding cassette subfamily B multidrug efflux pump